LKDLTPREIVAELDRYIIGQAAAKRAVAVAVRNRWRRQRLPEAMRAEAAPKNILMIGPTGVGKTEISRRIARLVNAPFVKVEASRYTEVGYHGRDVESMVRDLLEIALKQVQAEQTEAVRERAEAAAEDRLLDLLLPESADAEMDSERRARWDRTREKFRAQLRAGELDAREVEVSVEEKPPVGVFGSMGLGGDAEGDMQRMLESILPSRSRRRTVSVKEARRIVFRQEADKLINREKTAEEAVRRAEERGIIFIDEIDKVASSGREHGPDVSRQGVQRDLLPIVEGATVNTRHGPVRTDHILFIAAGAFHDSSPSDLMPELQGRFPLRVTLTDLTKEDFVRILREPEHSLVRQQSALLAADGVDLRFTDDGIEEIAELAHRLNRTATNIGARRLYTILEKAVEEVTFAAPDPSLGEVVVDAEFVRRQLAEIVKDEDLSKYIL
jgi:ATP-dependent HslUV protease ATP-binding subunit HslU